MLVTRCGTCGAVPAKKGLGPDRTGAIWPARRVRRALALVAACDVPPREARPPLFAALARLGIHCRPPLFMPFGPLALYGFGMIVGLLGACAVMAVGLGGGGVPRIGQVLADIWGPIVAIGLIFAPAYATSVRARDQDLRLPRWEDL